MQEVIAFHVTKNMSSKLAIVSCVLLFYIKVKCFDLTYFTPLSVVLNDNVKDKNCHKNLMKKIRELITQYFFIALLFNTPV